jgi:UDP-glucuronate 4-epimerase
MRILITGAAGFIGSALSLRLLDSGHEIIGIDNLNDYYDVDLKKTRLAFNCEHDNYTDIRADLADNGTLQAIFKKYRPQRVVNLAAQPGVRYSLINPASYINSNLVGFANVLEGCRHHDVEHLVYASSSSVYGANTSMPFSVHDNVDHPVSLYAASKKANELMAHSYSHLYGMATTGLRFFTVYGPWGRPDMAYFLFTKKILAGEAIDVYNYGNCQRDFTYIDDIVEGVIRVLDHVPQANSDWDRSQPDPASSYAPYRVYNIGNNEPVELMHYIEVLEGHLGRKAEKNLLPLQDGDVPATFANVDDLMRDVNYKPDTSVEQGLQKFVEWYLDYYQVKSA